MTSQRPAWFRFMRPSAPAPAPAPIRSPPPAVVRPPIPIRPPPQPTPALAPPPTAAPVVTAPAPAPIRSPPPVVVPIRPPPPPTPALAPPPPRFPVTTPAAPRVTPFPPAVAPLRSPPAAPPVPQSSPPVVPQPSRPRVLQRSPVVQLTSPPKTPPSSPFVPPPPVPISSPKTKTQAPSSSTLVANAASIGTVNGKAATPLSSPKIVKPTETTLMQSPNKMNSLSRDPSPFTLPPAQIMPDNEREPKMEQKSVLVQETIEKPMKIMPNAQNNGMGHNGKREATMKDKATNKKTSDSEENGMRIITLAGENKGAVMELSPSHKKVYSLGNPQKNKNTKTWSYNGDQRTSEEGKANDKDKNNRAISMQSPAMSAILNSNVQGVNNSIIYNIDYRQNNPGVHLSLTRKANGDRNHG